MRKRERVMTTQDRARADYDNPHISLGAGFRPLLRDKELAKSAIAKANAVRMDFAMSGRSTLALERQVAALTRTYALASEYPLGAHIWMAESRVRAARAELEAANEELEAVLLAEQEWLAERGLV